jgi:hypothetical protein
VDGVADFHIAPLENVSAARSHIGWHADFVVFQLDDVACICPPGSRPAFAALKNW